ncbi:MAG: hypothetical protein ACPGXY_00930 [Alphaproteobacteria bacterium]
MFVFYCIIIVFSLVAIDSGRACNAKEKEEDDGKRVIPRRTAAEHQAVENYHRLIKLQSIYDTQVQRKQIKADEVIAMALAYVFVDEEACDGQLNLLLKAIEESEKLEKALRKKVSGIEINPLREAQKKIEALYDEIYKEALKACGLEKKAEAIARVKTIHASKEIYQEYLEAVYEPVKRPIKHGKMIPILQGFGASRYPFTFPSSEIGLSIMEDQAQSGFKLLLGKKQKKPEFQEWYIASVQFEGQNEYKEPWGLHALKEWQGPNEPPTYTIYMKYRQFIIKKGRKAGIFVDKKVAEKIIDGIYFITSKDYDRFSGLHLEVQGACKEFLKSEKIPVTSLGFENLILRTQHYAQKFYDAYNGLYEGPSEHATIQRANIDRLIELSMNLTLRDYDTQGRLIMVGK